MAKFTDVLLTTDYDRTLTAPDATIPENNLEAICYFMENGGAFTVNTGRTVASSGLGVMGAENIVDGPSLWDQICIPNMEMLHMVFMDQLPDSLVTDTTHHFTELRDRQNIGIIRETVAVVFSVFHKINPLRNHIVNDGRDVSFVWWI